ncbi:MAG: hypothetical protein AABX38_02210 [Candidatus Micrarchaeota archaeon]
MAEFDELLITTGVDALVRLVKEKEKIELAIAAKTLGIPQSTIEDWAHILEEEGIISIDYSLTKIYLSWVVPKEDEILEREGKISESKKDISEDITNLRNRMRPELENFEDFKKTFEVFYQKISPRLKDIESTPVKAPKEAQDELNKQLEEITKKIAETEQEIETATEEFSAFKSKIFSEKKSELPDSELIKKKLEEFYEKLEQMQKKVEKSSKSVPLEMPKSADMKRALENLRKEFSEIKRACGLVRDDMLSLKETGDVIGEMGKEIKIHEQEITGMGKELKDLMDAAEQVSQRSEALFEKLKKNEDIVSRFNDSLDIAKGVFTRFPTQEKLENEIEKINEKEAKAEEKLDAFEKISLSLPKDLSAEFGSLKEDIDAEIEKLKTEGETLAKSISDQGVLYNTFQRIREKSAVSLQAYSTRFSSLTNDLIVLKKQATEIGKTIDSSLDAYSKKLKDKDLKETVSALEGIKDKKQTLDQINQMIIELSDSAEDVRKKLDLLSKESKFLDMRAEGISTTSGTAPTKATVTKEKEAEIAKQVKLTKDEEDEFRKKREELRDLIKKLWEEGS